MTKKTLALMSIVLICAACSGGSLSSSDSDSDDNSDSSPSSPGTITSESIDAWDELSTSDKNSILSWNTLFVHQSVGQDLEGGCETNGFEPEYFGPGDSISAESNAFYGGLFEGISNGDPTGKFEYFTDNVLANADALHVVIFKFGYADVEVSSLSAVESDYEDMVNRLKAEGLRIVHVTPPLVYDTSENSAKMDMREWMLATFADDVIFDLQDIESTDPDTGDRCEEGGIWYICDAIRSTDSCPSEGQGVDGPGQGHLCSTAADSIAKGLLYSIYQAGR